MRALFIFTALAVFAFGLIGCGSTPPNTNAGNTAVTNANNPLETTKKPVEEAKNAAPTMAPVVKAYCDAWAKGDDAALRKVYSAVSLKEFEADMKAEKAKRLIDFLKSDKLTGKTCEASNEQIAGDRAVVTFKADKYPTGIKLVFLKENGEWKLTTEMPDIDAVKKAQPAPNTNATK